MKYLIYELACLLVAFVRPLSLRLVFACKRVLCGPGCDESLGEPGVTHQHRQLRSTSSRYPQAY